MHAQQRASALPTMRVGAGTTSSVNRGASSVQTSPSEWRPLGPQPFLAVSPQSGLSLVPWSDQINAIAVNPANSQDIWVGAAAGGVWQTMDGGVNWQPVTDDQSSPAIGSIAIDPTNAATIYVGTGDPNSIYGGVYAGVGVLKSVNGGATWATLDSADFAGLAIGRIAVDPANTQVLLLSASWDGTGTGNPYKTGIWRSTNGGGAWTQVLGDPGKAHPDAGTDVLFDPADPSIAFAGLGNLFGLNATSASGVYKSVDNGVTWTQATDILSTTDYPYTPSDIERVSLSISQDGTHVYALLTDSGYDDTTAFPGGPFGALLDNGLYASTDTGATWSKHVGPSSSSSSTNHDYWRDSVLQVDPSDSNGESVYVGGRLLWHATDGGVAFSSWTRPSDPTTSPLSFHALAPLGPSSSSYMVGCDIGVWSGASGDVLTGKNGVAPNGLGLSRFIGGSAGEMGLDAQLYGASPWTGLAAYPSGPVNGPAAWTMSDHLSYYGISHGYGAASTLVDYTDNATAYYLRYFGGLNPDPLIGNNTIYGGQSWNDESWSIVNGGGMQDHQNLIDPFILSPSNHQELFIGTDRVWQSTDSGHHWAAVSSVVDPSASCSVPSDTGCIPLSALAVAPSRDTTLYAGDNAGNVSVSVNGGVNWTRVTSPCAACDMPIASLAVDPTSAQTVYASIGGYLGLSGHHIFRSTNGGLTWTDMSVSLPDAPVMSVIVDPNNARFIVAGSDVGVFASEDAGATWGGLGAGLPHVAVNQVFFTHTGDHLCAATVGRGMWEIEYPHIQVSPGGLALMTAPGVNPAGRSLSITNSGAGSLNWSIAGSLPSWVSASPMSGALGPGASQQINVSFNITSATPQTYTTNLTITAPGADNAPLPVPVTVVVAAGAKSWYFAEGYTGANFTEFLTLGNPNAGQANVGVTYYLGSGRVISKSYAVYGNARLTVSVNGEVGAGQNVSMSVVADQPIVAERPMYFTYTGMPGVSVPGGSDVLGATSLNSTFDFGYLDTGPGYDTWLTVLNHNPTDMTVKVRYFSASGSEIDRSHIVSKQSRGTIHVNSEGLPAGSYSALVGLTQAGTNTPAAGLVERPMYLVDGITHYTGSADVVGVTTPASAWYFAEGYSSSTFSERYVVSNPTTTPATVTITYLKSDGSTVQDSANIGAGAQHLFMAGATLGTGGVNNSAVVRAVAQSDGTTPVLVLAERFMSFAYGPQLIQGASDVLGAPRPAHAAEFAEGYTGSGFSEYLTIENPDPGQVATVQVTFLPQNGAAPTVMLYQIAPHSRFTLDTSLVMPGQSFSMTLLSNLPVVAERPMYFNYSNSGQTGGTDIIGYQP
jgi:hypothetical protein